MGGSSTTIWTNLALQIGGVAMIGWAAIARPRQHLDQRATGAYLLLAFGLLVVLLQLIPLPPAIWTELPGRHQLAEALSALGQAPSWAPISQDSYGSVLTLFAIIPAIAVFVATERLGPSPRGIGLAIVAGMIGSVFLGALQLGGGSGSWAYLQARHSPGAIGFFANENHMATLLLVAIPMTAALVVSAKSERKLSSAARYGVGAALLLMVAVGIVMNGSRAALGLALPVVLASATIFATAMRWRGLMVTVAALALAGGVVVVASNPIAPVETSTGDSSALMRPAIWSTTADAIGDTFPAGTGLGTFERAYHWYEDAADVGRQYINHAHNDYLEVVLELGAGGALLILLFLAWWALAAIRIWSSALATPFARAAMIATAVILAQSFVDFPLRTGAISAIFGACLGLMAQHLRAPAVAKPGEFRPTRHVKLG
ncbi:MAG TPA: O-antigen ligase family protein [Sphingomicrobium sp.]|nr:O-antigen ligase family protein [Sphingomicrobium sp.]